ncbi:MAG: hybrid sensor histidine kinase/response regulator [Anaerolineae bacterium]|nr:hybrid sensor histidine kinase/response regulator [Anaerolineae bacterium]
MAQASELLVSSISLEQRLTDVRQMRDRHAQWRKAWRKVRPAYARLSRALGAAVDEDDGDRDEAAGDGAGANGDAPQDRYHVDFAPLLDFLHVTQRYMRESAAHLLALDQDMSQDHLRMSMVASDLQDGVRRVRMLPFETILGGFQRMVRDLSRQLEKEVNFNVIGEQVELDKRVLEAIKDPIMHLLRNAIDHGIESPDERVRAGKDPEGYVTLIVEQRGGEILITIGDDGRGIDPESLKRAALRIGKLSKQEADVLDDDEAISLIFLPGLSTKDSVTTTSGRGIGMDVVRQNIERLRGSVIVQNRPGLGTVFQLTVPASLTTMHCMLARVGQEVYAIPVAAIERILEVTDKDIHTVKGRQVIKLGQRPVTLVALADVLERPQRPAPPGEKRLTVVLRAGDKLVAFLVDDLPSEQELVVKNLGKEMVRVRNVAGVTMLGTGQVVVILNPSDLVKSAQAATRQRAPQAEDTAGQARPAARILVVDDSITTRTLEKNILEAAGYQVVTATDGQEALDLIRHTRCDLIIADVEMPRMDGFRLTETLKADLDLKHLPLILVTSLDSPADRERGILAGADAYIIKSNFDQGELLETIGQLLY